ncbi:hypothetical protein BN946_scf185014.g129 [Trametes cinnabarina]|uniref:Nascent polypeptide-associated complex subunit alpha-like UBA domain-containing protein n=1 Tax=Pycnoporus cinnabarinus TaxID=5643 RepID=A0A060SN43_PYCCI|nr:hypothetical protein BN946_scf185014.g129 [Trametes cinnabarina]
MASVRSNGRPEAEVIVNFLDGQSYSKGKVEEAFRALHLDKPYSRPPKAAPSPFKAEDIELIAQEFDITRGQAEKVLSEAQGNVLEALRRRVGL